MFHRNELLARLEDLGMPDGSAVICQALSPLDALDPRFAGCTWKVLGREVPLTDDLPDYYFLRFSGDGVPSRQVQIWLWQVLPRDPPAYVGAPLASRRRRLCGLRPSALRPPRPPGGRQAAECVARPLPPPQSAGAATRSRANVVDAAHLERRLISTFQQLEKHGQPATRSRSGQSAQLEPGDPQELLRSF